MTTQWINIHIDGVPINQSNQSKSLGLIVKKISHRRPTFEKVSKKVSSDIAGIGALKGVRPLVSMHTAIKCTKVSSHTLIIAVLYGMALTNSLVRNFKNFKIVLSELSLNLQSWAKAVGTLRKRPVSLNTWVFWHFDPLSSFQCCNQVKVSTERIVTLQRGRGGLAIDKKDVFWNYGRTPIESVCFAQMCQHFCPWLSEIAFQRK